MSSAGFAAILARLQAPELRGHCDEALRMELMQVQHRLHDVGVAMQRLRSVGSAVKSLGNQDISTPDGHSTLLQSLEKMQRDLGRAVVQFGSSIPPKAPVSTVFVCCKCQNKPEKLVAKRESEAESSPLLAKPDTAALSPPRRSKPPVKRALLRTTQPRKKLVVPRRTTILSTESREYTPPSLRIRKAKIEKTEEPQIYDKTKKEEEEDVHVIDVDAQEDAVKQEGDIRVRLLQRIEACWPLATSLGALEMRQRRSADYADLVTRVCALFRVLFECDGDDMANRSMRSVLVKARDSLAVAVSLLSLHDVTNANAPLILALVRAVDAASHKHRNLQKHIAPFRDSLAEMEVALLTRRVVQPQAASTGTPKKKPRTCK